MSKRNDRIELRCSEDEKLVWRDLAASREMSLGEWLRSLAVEESDRVRSVHASCSIDTDAVHR